MSRMIPSSVSRSSRRTWLFRSGGLLLAWMPAFRPFALVDVGAQGATAADLPVSEVMTTLSAYMSRARDRALPSDVIEHATWHILDTFAAMVSGSELSPGRAALTFGHHYGGKACGDGRLRHAPRRADRGCARERHDGSCR